MSEEQHALREVLTPALEAVRSEINRLRAALTDTAAERDRWEDVARKATANFDVVLSRAEMAEAERDRLRADANDLAALRAEIERLKEQLRPDSPTERAPTQGAYDQVCASYHKYRDEAESLRAEKAELVAALEIIAGRKQCIDNLMSNGDIARAALAKAMATEGDTR